jgi:hypothetical protein
MASEASPGWLTDASLATTPEDRLHHLREASGETADPLLQLHAAAVGLARGRLTAKDVAHVGLRLSWDNKLPDDVIDAVYELDEGACCAHDFNCVPNAARVEAAIARLNEQLLRVSPWQGGLLAVCAATTRR